MPIDPIDLTRKLVGIESTTYHEGHCGHFLHEYLTGLGYDVERQPVSQTDPSQALSPQPAQHAAQSNTPRRMGTTELATEPAAEAASAQPMRRATDIPGESRFNLYARMPGTTPTVTLSTHFDTVPPYFGLSEDDEYLYGRGTCDAKGILASQIAAADKLYRNGTPVGLLFVVGEERDSAGAKVANLDGHGSRFLINGEPTENRLALATKGALRVVLNAKGKAAHSAYPELGESAIEKLLAVLNDLLDINLPTDPEIGPCTLNIGLISGGRAPNVIPDLAEAQLLIRTVGNSQPVKDLIKQNVRGRVEVTYSLDLAAVRMKRIPGWQTMIAKYATDISSLTAWGEPMLLGPGTIHVAHTPEEKVLKRELTEAVDKYAELAAGLM